MKTKSSNKPIEIIAITVIFLLVFCAIFMLSGCGNDSGKDSSKDADKPMPLTTENLVGDWSATDDDGNPMIVSFNKDYVLFLQQDPTTTNFVNHGTYKIDENKKQIEINFVDYEPDPDHSYEITLYKNKLKLKLIPKDNDNDKFYSSLGGTFTKDKEQEKGKIRNVDAVQAFDSALDELGTTCYDCSYFDFTGDGTLDLIAYTDRELNPMNMKFYTVSKDRKTKDGKYSPIFLNTLPHPISSLYDYKGTLYSNYDYELLHRFDYEDNKVVPRYLEYNDETQKLIDYFKIAGEKDSPFKSIAEDRTPYNTEVIPYYPPEESGN